MAKLWRGIGAAERVGRGRGRGRGRVWGKRSGSLVNLLVQPTGKTLADELAKSFFLGDPPSSGAISASASVSLSIVGVATARLGIAATASFEIPILGVATGSLAPSVISGASAFTLPIQGVAQSAILVSGSASFALPIGGVFDSDLELKAQASISLPILGAATGRIEVRAATSFVLSISGAASGSLAFQSIAGQASYILPVGGSATAVSSSPIIAGGGYVTRARPIVLVSRETEKVERAVAKVIKAAEPKQDRDTRRIRDVLQSVKDAARRGDAIKAKTEADALDALLSKLRVDIELAEQARYVLDQLMAIFQIETEIEIGINEDDAMMAFLLLA
ncbi:MAG: hypothetical protein ACRC6I_18145 [Paracoccaceae bacterium]